MSETPLKLDIGCGKSKQIGYYGIDRIKFDGVDLQMNVVKKLCEAVLDEFGNELTPAQYVRWPWEDETVDEIHCSHFVEHLTREEWVPFFNEAWRVLKPGKMLRVIVPHWSHACAYGDPTHKSFLSEWVAHYLDKNWRSFNAPHTGYTCDFTFEVAGSWDDWLSIRAEDTKIFAMQHYINSYRDLILNLTKRKS